MNTVMVEWGALMSNTSDGYILRTRRVYEKALNDLYFLNGLINGLLNNNNDLPFKEYSLIPAKFNNIAQILDECIMNCEFHELEEGD